MEIVSGFEVAVAPYDVGMLMQSDITHKVVRNENGLDVMNRYRQSSPDYQRQVIIELVGSIIITK